jgi:hypothetical protein
MAYSTQGQQMSDLLGPQLNFSQDRLQPAAALGLVLNPRGPKAPPPGRLLVWGLIRALTLR